MAFARGAPQRGTYFPTRRRHRKPDASYPKPRIGNIGASTSWPTLFPTASEGIRWTALPSLLRWPRSLGTPVKEGRGNMALTVRHEALTLSGATSDLVLHFDEWAIVGTNHLAKTWAHRVENRAVTNRLLSDGNRRCYTLATSPTNPSW